MERMLICFAIINTFLEFLCILLLSEEIIEEKRVVNWRLLITIYFCIFCCGILSNTIPFLQNLYILNYLFMMILLSKEYDLNAWNAIKYTIFSVVIFGMIELAVYFVIYWAFHYLGIEQGVVPLVMIVTLCVCLFLKKRGVLYIGKKLFYKWDKTLYVIFICIILIFFYYVNLIKVSEGIVFKDFMILFILLIVLFLIIYKMYANRIEAELHRKYSEQYSEIIMEIRSRQHKFMNQLQSICMLSEIYKSYDELVAHQRRELGALERYMLPNKLLILERPLLITHIYNKMCEAEEKHIEMVLQVSCSLDDVNIPDIHMIEIIGNLLDNALEEVERRKLNEKIFLSIYSDGKMKCINVSNEHEKIPFCEYKDFFLYGFSTKGSQHGIGLAHIKKIVNKYGGRIEVGNVEKYGLNLFSICVYIKTISD